MYNTHTLNLHCSLLKCFQEYVNIDSQQGSLLPKYQLTAVSEEYLIRFEFNLPRIHCRRIYRISGVTRDTNRT